MREQGLTRLLLGIVITSAAFAVADDKVPAPAQSGAVTGRVVDVQGRPVAEASVMGLAYQETIGPVKTDRDGRFRLPGLDASKPVTVWAEAPGLARERRDDVHPFPGADYDIGTITLLPGTQVVGRAVDAHGKAIAGASIKLELYRHQLGHTITSQGARWTFNADAEGRMTSPPLGAGQAVFSLSAPGKVRTTITQVAQPGTATIHVGDITLEDEIAVGGIVTDNEGHPAPGVAIIPDYDYDNSATTDRDGRFVLHGVGKDLKELMLESNDYFATKPVEVAPGQTELKLSVIKAYTIDGTAVDAESGKPVPIESVRLCIVLRDPDDGSITLAG